MDIPMLIIIVAVVILVLGVALVLGGRVYRTRRTAALRRHFGEEYDRVVADLGSRRRGEAELRARIRRRRALSIRRLDAEERSRYAGSWDDAERTFVNTPATGLRDADLLVMQVMRDRGYPVEQFQERAKLISVDYPDLVEHFRAAHTIAVANEDDAAETEQIRQAMVDYRFVFDELLEGGDAEPARRS